MQSMNLIHKILILLFGVAISAQAVPPVLNYAGQVAVNGEAFEGNGLFKFALVNADGTTTYWSNDGTSVDGSEPQVSVAVVVNGGLYSILLGNTAQQGMGAIDPAVFTQHTDAKLRVWFSDGVNGFQQLSPDRPFASVPYAFSSESAKSADTANTAMTVKEGAISKSMLGQDVLSELNGTIIAKKLAHSIVTTAHLNDEILKYLKPSFVSISSSRIIDYDSNISISSKFEGRFLSYQWKKNGVELAGETQDTLKITDANATNHDGNYSLVVSNDFGRVESDQIKILIQNWNPKSITGMKLWLDASNLDVANSLWRDKSDSKNNAKKRGTPKVVVNAQSGNSLMRYSGGYGEYHVFNRISDVRTVFCILKREQGAAHRHLLGDSIYNDFHSSWPDKIFSSSNSNNFKLLFINGMDSSLIGTSFPTKLSLISLTTSRNLNASNFSLDRNMNDRVWQGDLGELLIFNIELDLNDIKKVEGYLAHKWGLTSSLPSTHPYINNPP